MAPNILFILSDQHRYDCIGYSNAAPVVSPNFTQRMIRNKKWKYVWNPTDIDELYDMESDPYELMNLINCSGNTNILIELRHNLFAELTKDEHPIVAMGWMNNQLLNQRKL